MRKVIDESGITRYVNSHSGDNCYDIISLRNQVVALKADNAELRKQIEILESKLAKECEKHRSNTRHKTGKSVRSAAMNRDGFKCVICGSIDNLQVHHKIHKADGGTDDLSNLSTLCLKCHCEQHKGQPVYNIMVKSLSRS